MTGAANYAEALFSLSEELGQSESVLADVAAVRDALSANPDYFKLTDTPSLSVPEKLSLISDAFASVGESVRNLLLILCEKHSVHIFPDVAKEYVILYNDSRNIITAEVTGAVMLSAEQIERIRVKLNQITGKTVNVVTKTDPDLLGGIRLAFMGRQLDGSLRARLSSIEDGLKNTIL